jgi:hypothetical protein
MITSCLDIKKQIKQQDYTYDSIFYKSGMCEGNEQEKAQTC